jgi:hypothetical protein
LLKNCDVLRLTQHVYYRYELLRKRGVQAEKTGKGYFIIQLAVKEEEHRRELTRLQQKVELLQAEVGDYQEKEFKNRQLN